MNLPFVRALAIGTVLTPTVLMSRSGAITATAEPQHGIAMYGELLRRAADYHCRCHMPTRTRPLGRDVSVLGEAGGVRLPESAHIEKGRAPYGSRGS